MKTSFSAPQPRIWMILVASESRHRRLARRANNSKTSTALQIRLFIQPSHSLIGRDRGCLQEPRRGCSQLNCAAACRPINWPTPKVAPAASRIPEAPRARAPSSPTTRALRHHAVDANQPRLCGKRCRHHGHRNPSHRHGQDSAPGERHQGRAQLRGARNLRHGIHHPQGGGPEAASADRRSRPETRRNPTLSP